MPQPAAVVKDFFPKTQKTETRRQTPVPSALTRQQGQELFGAKTIFLALVALHVAFSKPSENSLIFKNFAEWLRYQ